jgi:hypothetical protein
MNRFSNLVRLSSHASHIASEPNAPLEHHLSSDAGVNRLAGLVGGRPNDGQRSQKNQPWNQLSRNVTKVVDNVGMEVYQAFTAFMEKYVFYNLD